MWDLGGGVDFDTPEVCFFGKCTPSVNIRIPSFKLVRFELQALYYRGSNGLPALQGLWADETHLGAGWHIDASSVNYGRDKEGGAFGSAKFGAGGANPFQVVGYNTTVDLRQHVELNTGEITSNQNIDIFPLGSALHSVSGFGCTGWQ